MPEEQTIDQQVREELRAIRMEALHGDHRAALARLIENLESGINNPLWSALMERMQAVQAFGEPDSIGHE